ncbi:hypothetical protein PSU4_37800 [Pseudonocardia sulfidoxydans NBRC 16205]|uniref:Uncharacterized protein n=1 Tax=Pseudonocardia sulfidoxydans NBRC 16205 TaxID=1223511 RepID=A0A511DJ35_9PSEU|nr:hypothetical protein PSU4_37800 [Pseudonocardia sulfidoxydans NBRC 16205]
MLALADLLTKQRTFATRSSSVRNTRNAFGDGTAVHLRDLDVVFREHRSQEVWPRADGGAAGGVLGWLTHR